MPGMGNAGTVIDEPVIGTDYYPTVLEVAGIGSLPSQHPDGKSLVPLFDGEASLDREAIYWHFPHYSNHGMQSPGGAIRCGNYKLLEYFENGTVQLFDLAADPGEHCDLYGQLPDVVEELLLMLDSWRDKVGAEDMELNPDFDATATVSDGANQN